MAAFLDDLPVFPHGLEAGQRFDGGAGPDALVLRHRDRLAPGAVAFLVEQRLFDRDRGDLLRERPLGKSGFSALLALRGIGVLRFAADAIAFGDDLRRLDHRHVGVGFVRQHRLVGKARRVLGHRQADRFHAPGQCDIDIARDDRARRQCERGKAGAAFAVEREGGDALRQPGSEHRHAPGISALGAPLIAYPPEDVVDPRRIDPGTLDRSVHHMRGKDRRLGRVERAAIGLANARPGGGDDRGFAHGHPLIRISGMAILYRARGCIGRVSR